MVLGETVPCFPIGRPDDLAGTVKIVASGLQANLQKGAVSEASVLNSFWLIPTRSGDFASQLAIMGQIASPALESQD
jgi:hypothetical protein